MQSKHLIFDEPIAGYSLADAEFSLDHAFSAHSSTEARSSSRVEEPLQDALEANEFRIIAETVKAAPTKQAAAKQLGISERRHSLQDGENA